jgi:hypothetical protein
MSYATFVRKTPVVSASAAQSATSATFGALRIGKPDDAYEREADRIADQVESHGPSRQQWSQSDAVTSTLRRNWPCDGSSRVSGSSGVGFDSLQCRKTEDENTLARKALRSEDSGVAPPIVHEVLNSPGRPLDHATSSFIGRAYGHDFSRVRVHTDDKATRSAKSVKALAYTVGKHVVFDATQCVPGSGSGRHLLAHELAHVVQQNSTPLLRRQTSKADGGKIGPLVQKFIRGEATPQEKETLRNQLLANQLTPEEVDALKQYIGRQIADAIMAKALAQQGQVMVSLGGPVGDVHRFFKAKLRLHLSGATKALVGGLEGTLETVAEVKAEAATKKVTIYISPPPGDTMLAELVRAKVFPNGERTFELGETFLKLLNMISLQREITIVLTGKKSAKSGGLVITSPDIPEDVELEATLSQSAERPALAPATGAPALPSMRTFVTGGVVTDPKQTGAATTVGFDLPLFTDTKNPLTYGGLGARVGADTRGGLRAGGAGFVGLNLNPITLQLAFEAGIARFPAGQTLAGTGPTGKGYFGAEASVGVRVSKNVEVMALASLLGGLGDRDLLGAGSVQVGAGYKF